MKKQDADERRCLGRSRGGLTTKVHSVTGRSGRLVAFQLTVGQRGDAPLREQLLKDFKRGDVGTIIADAAYDSDAIRTRARQLRAKVCIKPNAARTKKRPQKEKEIQQDGLQTPQSHRTILWKNQTLPPHRHTLREKASKLRQLHLARSTHYRHDLNVRTT